MIGCTLVTFSVPFALAVIIIGPKAQLVVTCLSSILFYLIAIMLSLILWKLLPFFHSTTMFLLASVIVIEIVRKQFHDLCIKAERSFNTVSTNRVVFPLDDLSTSVSAGAGWGLCHILMYYFPMVAKSVGPGTYFLHSCSSFSVVTKASFFSFSIFLQQIFFMIIFFDALKIKVSIEWWLAFFAHIFVAIWSELGIDCGVLVAGEVIIAICLGIWSWYLVHKPAYRRKLKKLE